MSINADALKILLNLNGADTSTTITDSSKYGSTITNNQGSYGYNSTDTSKFGSASGKFLNTRTSHTAVNVVTDSGTLLTSSGIVYDITLPVGTVIYNATRNAYSIVYDYDTIEYNIGGAPTPVSHFKITPAISGQVAGDTIYYAGSDIQIPVTNINFNTDFSISFWAKAGAGAGVIFDTRSNIDDSENFYVVLHDNDTLSVRYNSNSTKGTTAGKAGTEILATTGAVSTSTFSYIEVFRRNGIFGIYIDNTLEDYTDTWYHFDPSTIQLGNIVSGAGAGFNGYIDELQIWDGISKYEYNSTIQTLETAEYTADDIDVEVSNIALETEIEADNIIISNFAIETEIEANNLVISNFAIEVEVDPDTIILEECQILIGGIDYIDYVDLKSIKINLQDNYSNSASLRLVTNSNSIKMGMELIIKKGSKIFFGGLIQQPKRTLLSPSFMVVDIYSEGYKQILGRRTFVVDAQNQFAGDIVSGIFNDFIITGSPTSEELLLGNIEDGVQVENYVKPAETGMKIFNDMADASAFKWWITNDKKFYFQSTPTYVDYTATKTLTSDKTDPTYINCIDMPIYDEDSSKFRTRQFVIGKTLDDTTIVGSYSDSTAETEMASRYGSGVYGSILTNNNINNETDADTMAQTEVETYVNPAKIQFKTYDEIDVLELINVDIPLLEISDETYKITNVQLTIEPNCRMQRTITAEKYIAETKQKRVWTDEFNEMLKTNTEKPKPAILYDEISGGASITTIAPDTRTLTITVDIDKALHVYYSIVGTCAGAATITVTIAIDTVTKKVFTWDEPAGNFSKTLAFPIRTITESKSSASITAVTSTTATLTIAGTDLTFWANTN